MADPGWYQDPYSRYGARWFDGQEWTAHVASGSDVIIDPLGAGYASQAPSTTTPAQSATPSSDDAAPASSRPVLRSSTAATGADAMPGAASGSTARSIEVPGGPATEANPAAVAATASSAPPTGSPPPSSVTAATHPTPPVSGGSGSGFMPGVVKFLDSLGPDARDRPQPRLATALGGLGGFTAAGGFVGLLGQNPQGATIALLYGLIFAGAVVIMLKVPSEMISVRAGAVGAGVVAAIFIALGLTVGDLDNFDVPSPAAVSAIIAILLLGGWALPGFKGRPVFFALGLLALVTMIAAAFARSGPRSRFGRSNVFEDVLFGIEDRIQFQSWVFLVLGVLLLAAMWQLDRLGFRGVATGVALSALLSSIIGLTLFVIVEPNPGGAVLVIAIGLLASVIGALGQHRVTLWLGALIFALALGLLLTLIITPDDLSTAAITALMAGAALIGLPFLIKKIIGRDL